MFAVSASNPTDPQRITRAPAASTRPTGWVPRTRNTSAGCLSTVPACLPVWPTSMTAAMQRAAMLPAALSIFTNPTAISSVVEKGVELLQPCAPLSARWNASLSLALTSALLQCCLGLVWGPKGTLVDGGARTSRQWRALNRTGDTSILPNTINDVRNSPSKQNMRRACTPFYVCGPRAARSCLVSFFAHCTIHKNTHFPSTTEKHDICPFPQQPLGGLPLLHGSPCGVQQFRFSLSQHLWQQSAGLNFT